MDNWLFLITVLLGVAGLLLAPSLIKSESLKRKIIISTILIISVIFFFNSDDYKHRKYFDESKLFVRCLQLPPMLADEDNFYYRYLVFFKNDYPSKIKIDDVRLKFQSSLNIDQSDILLNDIPVKNLRIDRESKSIIVYKLEEIQSGQIFSSSIDCSLPRRGLLVANNAATLNITYTLFGETHTKSYFINPINEMAIHVPQKKDILFDIVKVFDNRSLPKDYFTYHYDKIPNDSDVPRLEIYCEDNKDRLLKIKFTSKDRKIILQSENHIHPDVDPLRLVVNNNDDISVFSWLGIFRQENAAAQFRLGLQSVKEKKYEAASQAFKNVTDIDPQDYQAWFNYGLALDHLPSGGSASISAYRNAIKVNGNYPKAHYQLGHVLLLTGKIEEGAQELQRAIQLNPRYSLAYFRLGCFQRSQGKEIEALKNINEAIKNENNAERREMYKRCLGQISKSDVDNSELFIDDYSVNIQ